MSIVRVKISFCVGLTASINSGFFGGSQVDIGFTLDELETETSSLSEVDSFVLAFFLGRVVLSL